MRARRAPDNLVTLPAQLCEVQNNFVNHLQLPTKPFGCTSAALRLSHTGEFLCAMF